jgi:hypothetical protein
MLYTENLDQIVFHRHELFDSDELIILSWYLWPDPVNKLTDLPIRSTVIYGMYWSEWIKPALHRSLKNIQQSTPPSLNIFYSQIPVHSKCYVWKKDNSIVHALIWSANFSINWLTTPFREVLAETTRDTFQPLNTYIDHVLWKSISCLETWVREASMIETLVTQECFLTLLTRNWEIHKAWWLNWWQNPDNHTRLDDAYIPIRIQDIENFPWLFPPKQTNPVTEEWWWRRRWRHNDSIDIIWDDWVTMRGLLEWSQEVDWKIYPKQISSFPNKSELWVYMRHRLWVPLGQPVRKHHLERYGRLNVEVSLLWDWVYSFNFSQP